MDTNHPSAGSASALQPKTPALSPPLDPPPYTIFQKGEKAILMLILSLIGFCSAISSPIYFPALPTLTSYFKVSEAVINLSVVAYLVFQGIAPTFVGSVADVIGMRPVLVLSAVVFTASCFALSQTNVYWLFAVLRCIQAAGIAPVVAVAASVSGDVCTPRDRGGFVGTVSGMQLVGNGFGGIIGAALILGFNTWRAIFVFLGILGGFAMVLSALLLPETSRLIVGNGSIVPKSILNRLLFSVLPHFRKQLTNDYSTLRKRNKLDLLSSYKILVVPEVFASLVPSGIHYAGWTIALTSLSTELENRYKYSVMHVGLIYLPQGIATLVSSVVTGKALNYYYRYRRAQYDEKYKDTAPENRPSFNISRTRIDICIVPATSMVIGLLMFGWCLQYRKAAISIIIASTLISFSTVSLISCATTLLVDLFPGKSSSSISCLNLVRCMLAALFTGILDHLIQSMGLGGCYTFMAGLCLLSDLMLVCIILVRAKKVMSADTVSEKQALEESEEVTEKQPTSKAEESAIDTGNVLLENRQPKLS
ncbi:putative plasma membrane transporter of the major facilitator superfamily [Suhomyces tanzawaensis NRRL Y-17324]|uniref:Putative plasma membrane transporter of the major facilitator superfamily n=1 Tax=Suhomyces tanzawaensis NRRL Y-17324 TaxID=984487 RepID=A0A1E4SKF2_9ASCO|nr:putative plasma membrane transporter of the major facilitator superfamily [Suhomyces tanzawaensis NRRL Y-17324]ODV79978.1 putative plasma membrane transporter of the major facilitator superfamily [Suhomyces tanzawaensis NRRL Y-17324]